MNDHLLESSMGSAQDFTPGQRMIRERSLWVWLFAWSEPKLRADLDAPPGEVEDGWVCSACDDSGVRSYHELPGTYGREPCGECGE